MDMIEPTLQSAKQSLTNLQRRLDYMGFTENEKKVVQKEVDSLTYELKRLDQFITNVISKRANKNGSK